MQATSLTERGDLEPLGLVTVGSRGVPAIGDPGRAARELGAGRPPRMPSVPDHVLSEFSTDDLEIRAASVRGLLHRCREQPRQDAFSVAYDPGTETTVVVVSDGVGSLPRSDEAAALVVQRLPGHYWTHRNWTDAVEAVNLELQELVRQIERGLDSDERTANGLATTVVAVAIVPSPDGRRAQVVRSDDSTVWCLSPDRLWSAVSAADEDTSIHTGSVRALPAAAPRLHHADIAFDHGALFVMTDGVGVPLSGSVEVQAGLAAWWADPPTIFEFGSQVGFARKSHLDDRTVVGVWSTAPADRVGESP